MNIFKLTLTSNPWLPIPSSMPPKTRPASKTIAHFRIAPLTEMCLRVLLSPVGAGLDETVLEQYELPLDDTRYSTEIRNILSSCVPGSVARPGVSQGLDDGPSSHSPSSAWASRQMGRTNDGATDLPDIGVCPSPRHRMDDGEWVGGRKPVFVRWAEERFTWEKLGGAETTLIPVKWRGCGRGCLDFLNDEGDDEAVEEGEEDGDHVFLKSSGGSASTAGVQVVDVGAGVGDWTDEEFV